MNSLNQPVTTGPQAGVLRKSQEGVAGAELAVFVAAPHDIGYANAYIVPHLRVVQEACERVGAELLVDAYHALNGVPFSLTEEGLQRATDIANRSASAAQEDTPERLDRGLFRHDLFQRLAGIVIDLPLLVDRPEDIVPLAEHFAAAHGQRLDDGTAAVLEGHDWPGNVRELRLAIERAGCLVENGTLPPGAVRDAIELGRPLRDGGKDRRTAERRAAERRGRGAPRRSWHELVKLCVEHRGDAARIAASLGIRRSALYDCLKTAGLSLRSFRDSGRPPEFHRNSGDRPEKL